MRNGALGEKYNIGGENEWENITLLEKLIGIVAAKTGRSAAAIRDTISHVADRPGHDRRYAIDCSKIRNVLGWKQTLDFETGLERTVDWYLANPAWIERIRSGEYRRWIETNYDKRQ